MNLTIGDHLVTPRTGYTHHGLYVGDGLVIHYSGLANDSSDGEIEIVSLSGFANQKEIYVQTHSSREYSRQVSVDRAYSRLGENWYNVLLNNCEHFVNWCIDGKHKSEQVNTAVNTVLIGYELYKNKDNFPKPQTHTLTTAMLNVVGHEVERQVVRNTVSTAAGFATTAVLTTSAGSATTAAITSIAVVSGAPIVATVAAGAAVCYGVSKVIDWFWD